MLAAMIVALSFRFALELNSLQRIVLLARVTTWQYEMVTRYLTAGKRENSVSVITRHYRFHRSNENEIETRSSGRYAVCNV